MANVDPEEWAALWQGICELSSYFEEGVVFIGGVAVYLHARAARLSKDWIEFSHDGDFYISLSDFADLRDVEEVTANRRLSKYQFIKNGIEFDVYLEYNSRLRVPYADVLVHSTVIEKVRVASLEHLLLLKLDAYADRRASAKGRKDERDLIRISHLLVDTVRPELIRPFLLPHDAKCLGLIARQSAEFSTISADLRRARKLRAEVDKLRDVLLELENES